MATHRRLAKIKGPDFYVTPAWGTEALLANEPFVGTILEPCCGNGAMAEVIKAAKYHVIASDLYDRGYGRQRDFFKIKSKVSNIITNPPFNIAEDILERALELAYRKVALLLRLAFVESSGRYRRFFCDRPPVRILAFSKRLSIYPATSKKASGGTTSYAWFIWDQGDISKQTQLKWIKP